MIRKPTIIVTSIGRTGTEFFAKFFSDILPNSTSLHEPDIFQNTGVKNKFGHYVGQVRRAGIWRMGVLKALGKWTLVKLSDARFTGRIDQQNAVRELNFHRRDFVAHMPGAVYVEANIGYYGLLDIMPSVFEHHKAIYIVRDGRDWVQSHMNWGEFYGKHGLRRLISHSWPGAKDLRADSYASEWDGFSRFERLCWAWSKMNEYALDTIANNSQVRLYRFEEIFSGEQRYRTLDELVAFATSIPGCGTIEHNRTDGWLERRIHQSPTGFPAWDQWTADETRQFDRLCGKLMSRLGYQ